MSLPEQLHQPFEGLTVVPGFAGTYPAVIVGGVPQPATWPDNVYAAPGDPLLIGYIVKGDSQAQAIVLGRAGSPGPREATVTAAPGGSDTITATASSVDYTVTFVTSYTPTVGDRVRLLWQGGDATVLGKVGITPAPSPAAPAVPLGPPPASSGVFDRAATDSATWSSGYGWNSYYGQNVYQGDGGGYGAAAVNNGAWFYAGAFAELAGAQINRFQFRVPARKSAGAYNSAGTLHLYTHNSPNRPGGDVTRVSGPYDISIAAGSAGGLVDLPTAAAATIIAGGGLSITGPPYMGFKGKAEDPASGQILIDWQR